LVKSKVSSLGFWSVKFEPEPRTITLFSFISLTLPVVLKTREGREVFPFFVSFVSPIFPALNSSGVEIPGEGRDL